MLSPLLALPALLPLLAAAPAPGPMNPSGIPNIAPPFGLFIGSISVTEGNAGTTAFGVTVVLQNMSTAFDVELVAFPGTADGTDFTFPPTRVTLQPNLPVTLMGTISGDRVFEGDEMFGIGIDITTGMYPFPVQPATVTITDDDGDLAPKLSADAVKVPEGNDGWHTIGVPVRLDRVATAPVSVNYILSGGLPATTLAPWGDYREKTGVVTIAAGQTSTTIPVEVNGDGAWEADSEILVTLAGTRGAILATAAFVVTLVNDDAPAGVTIADARTDEGNAGRHPATLYLTFAAPAPAQSSVRVKVVGGTARENEDFLGQTLVLHPPPGSTAMTFAVTILSDTSAECDEGVIVEYEGVGTGDDTPKLAKLLITDDDPRAPLPGGACADPFETRSTPADPLPTPKPDAGAPKPSDASATPGDAGTPAKASGGCAVAGGGGRGASFVFAFLALALALRRRALG